MNFAALDFETANSDRNSACSLGVVIVEKGEIKEKLYWLIKPPRLYFHPINISIHGITERDVADKPEFNALWDEIYSHIKGRVLVAHNASFDMSVLRYILDTYSISYPEQDYYCSVTAARKAWPGLMSYRLDSMAAHLGIRFNHHNALEDALVSARIIIEACRLNQAETVAELSQKQKTRLGRIFPGGYTAASQSAGREAKLPRASSIVAAQKPADASHPCFNKTFVFTGTLQSISRRNAMQKVVNAGGICADYVYPNVNYLVVGVTDYNKLSDSEKSSKLLKAEALIKKGAGIRIITEDAFIKLLKEGL